MKEDRDILFNVAAIAIMILAFAGGIGIAWELVRVYNLNSDVIAYAVAFVIPILCVGVVFDRIDDLKKENDNLRKMMSTSTIYDYKDVKAAEEVLKEYEKNPVAYSLDEIMKDDED